ncbi:MAG: MopE-related protein [bacterium]|nr:MopE-related protein [bacterium]
MKVQQRTASKNPLKFFFLESFLIILLTLSMSFLPAKAYAGCCSGQHLGNVTVTVSVDSPITGGIWLDPEIIFISMLYDPGHHWHRTNGAGFLDHPGSGNYMEYFPDGSLRSIQGAINDDIIMFASILNSNDAYFYQELTYKNLSLWHFDSDCPSGFSGSASILFTVSTDQGDIFYQSFYVYQFGCQRDPDSFHILVDPTDNCQFISNCYIQDFDYDYDYYVQCNPDDPSVYDCQPYNSCVTPGPESCDGYDSNCDGQMDPDEIDADNDKWLKCSVECNSSCNKLDFNCWAKDCDDNDASVYPGASEICDQKDNNCNGLTDEGLSWDNDGDGYTSKDSCAGSKNDCDDNDASTFPGAQEFCDDKDRNCNDIKGKYDADCIANDDQLGENIDKCAIDQGTDPVNVITGNFYTNPQRDLTLKGENIDIEFYRIYNSQKIYDGPIGFGWVHNYDLSLINLAGGRVKIVREDGKGLYFTPNSFGGYISPRGLKYQLNLNQGVFNLINPQGKIYSFDNTGRLDKITSPVGGILTFTYSPEGRLIKIISSEGPDLTLNYDDVNGKIASITAPEGETLVSYTYDQINNLSEVDYPDGTYTTYSYGAWSYTHNMTSISNYDNYGNALFSEYVKYIYANPNLVREISNSRGESKSFDYYPSDNFTAIFSNTNDIHQGGYYEVHYDPDLGVSTEIMGDDCDCGGSNASDWDASGNNLHRTKYTDKNGNETFYQNYDSRGNPGKIIDPLGNETLYAYHPILNTPLYIIKDSVFGGNNAKKITIYDYDDPPLATDSSNNDPTQFNQNPTNKLHRLIEKGFTYDYSGQIVSYTYVTRYSYESDETNGPSNIIVLTDLNGDIWLVPYLPEGNFGSKIWIANLGLQIPYPVVADYDQDGDFDIALIGTENIYLLQNDGNLNFTTKVIATGLDMSNDYYWGAMATAGDFFEDANHLPDIAIQAGNWRRLIILTKNETNNGEIQFLDGGSFPTPDFVVNATQLKSGDFNNDGHMDLVVGHYANDTCIMFGDGVGNFPTYGCYTGPYCPGSMWQNMGLIHNPIIAVAVIAGDFDGDGNSDVLAGQNHDFDPGQAYFFAGNGQGNLNLVGFDNSVCLNYYLYNYGYDANPWLEVGSGYGFGYGATGDLDGDGKLDVVTSASGLGIIYFHGNGDGTFGPLTQIDPWEGRVDVASGMSMGTGVKKLVSIDGPRTDIGDITQFSYYPDNSEEEYNRGRLRTATDPSGGVTRYENYNLFGNPTEITDPNGHLTLNEYDLRNRLNYSVQKEAGPSGEDFATQYWFDGMGSIRGIQFPNGEWIEYDYENYTHNLTGIYNGNQWVNYGYDYIGNQTFDGINYREFDKNDRLIRIYNPNYEPGTIYTEFENDPNGNLTSQTDDNGNTIQYEYDVLNRLVRISSIPAGQPSSLLASYQYDSQDNLVSVTSFRVPGSAVLTNYSYDDMGRLVQIDSPDSGTTRFQYDEAGNLIAKSDGNGKAFTYQYDSLNRLVIQNDSAGSQVSYAYDQGTNEKGRLSTVTDPSGSSSYEYDQRGNLSQENKTLGSLPFALSYSYDANGNLVSITYPSGREVGFQYENGLVTGVNATLDGEGTTLANNFTYDSNLLSEKAIHFYYGNGLEFEAALNARYNPESWKVRTEEQLNPILVRGYNYDSVDNIVDILMYETQESDQQGIPTRTDHFTYDPLNRLGTASSPAAYGDFVFDYDLAGNRIESTRGSKVTTYLYSSGSNLLTNYNDPLRAWAWTPNSGGSPQARYEAAINGMKQYHKELKKGKNLTPVSAGEVLVNFYGIIKGSGLAEVGVDPGVLFRIWLRDNSTFPSISQLRALVGDDPAHIISQTDYNLIGNFILEAQKLNIFKELEEGTNVSHDANGNIVRIWDEDPAYEEVYEYDAQNQMVKASVNGMVVGEYSYDSQGRRVKKKSFGSEILYIYDQFSNLVSEYDAIAGQYIRDYIWLNGKPLAMIKFNYPPPSPPSPPSSFGGSFCATLGLQKTSRDQMVLFGLILSPFLGLLIYRSVKKKKWILLVLISLGSFGFGLLAFQLSSLQADTTPGEEIFYYHNDHLGTPIKMTDSSENVVWSMDCSPFQELCNITGSITNNLRFPGQYYDAETGLHYNGHRYYSSKLGRYMTADPVSGSPNDPQTYNPYPYVANNPVNLIDPEGLEATCKYSQSTGSLSCVDECKKVSLSALCYSGFMEGKNNPYMQDVKDVGPIPRGEWKINNAFQTIIKRPGHVIRNAIYLRPLANNDVWSTNRKKYDSFYIHGDNQTHPGDSSTGCIICLLKVRQEIIQMGGGSLTVTR